jgi:hypothetical protein
VSVTKKGMRTVCHHNTTKARTENDYYPTPTIITRLFLEHEFLGHGMPILEPCVGKARAMEHVLLEKGYRVKAYDIDGEGDEKMDFFDMPEKSFDTVMTNPPFSCHTDFILHAKKVARDKICLLMPLNYLTGNARFQSIWDDDEFPLSKVYVFVRGIDFQYGSPFADTVQASQLYCAWYVWEKDHYGDPTIHWLNNHPYVGKRLRTYE